ncbi:hypothetical protein A5757_02535 [Mycobacterium sp. 852013-51886_SCH5428379]|uniref:hypothetical protein n=1 Tax=Mycobacterium sp. 852013-51886_SCH5428379 TaxID=1834111 RepID=UPI0007FDFAD3|nr:hypothetical protein [Mycobacterium sp. 852013-51886_SCH5428379]OBB55941.1 hypothetical protein A5757_02535 [Mycobacterium sp. 852013-51886_SCH5428379]
MRYRIDVLTDSVREAVRHAGGLMFDRRRAGWQVVVVTDDVIDTRALDILGVRVESPGDADPRLRAPDREDRPVLTARGDVTAERYGRLLVWGEVEDASTGVVHRVRHTLSPAAQRFKAQALFSRGLPTSVQGCEDFWADRTVDGGGLFDLAVVGREPVVGR